MKATFTAIVQKDEVKSATGFRVPAEVITALGGSKRPPVVVTVGRHTYRSTVSASGDVFMLPLSAEHREAAGLKAGDVVELTLELDEAPRTVSIPDDLAAALAAAPGATAAFDALAYSARKEHVRQVESAKAAETRSRRIANIVAKVVEG
jgi:hypothetical protein